jgi:hypothetical protein
LPDQAIRREILGEDDEDEGEGDEDDEEDESDEDEQPAQVPALACCLNMVRSPLAASGESVYLQGSCMRCSRVQHMMAVLRLAKYGCCGTPAALHQLADVSPSMQP